MAVRRKRFVRHSLPTLLLSMSGRALSQLSNVDNPYNVTGVGTGLAPGMSPQEYAQFETALRTGPQVYSQAKVKGFNLSNPLDIASTTTTATAEQWQVQLNFSSFTTTTITTDALNDINTQTQQTITNTVFSLIFPGTRLPFGLNETDWQLCGGIIQQTLPDDITSYGTAEDNGDCNVFLGQACVDAYMKKWKEERLNPSSALLLRDGCFNIPSFSSDLRECTGRLGGSNLVYSGVTAISNTTGPDVVRDWSSPSDEEQEVTYFNWKTNQTGITNPSRMPLFSNQAIGYQTRIIPSSSSSSSNTDEQTRQITQLSRRMLILALVPSISSAKWASYADTDNSDELGIGMLEPDGRLVCMAADTGGMNGARKKENGAAKIGSVPLGFGKFVALLGSGGGGDGVAGSFTFLIAVVTLFVAFIG